MQGKARATPAEREKYYPKNYWFTAEDSAAGRLEEIYRRFVLRDHVHFVQRALNESGESGPLLDVGCGGGLFLRLLPGPGAPRHRPHSSSAPPHRPSHPHPVPTPP